MGIKLRLFGILAIAVAAAGCGGEPVEQADAGATAGARWSASADPSSERVEPRRLVSSPIPLDANIKQLSAPDGPSRFALVSYHDGDHVLFDLESGERAGTLDRATYLDPRVTALSEDGRFVCSRQKPRPEAPLDVRSLATGETVHSFSAPSTQGQFSAVDFADSDKLFAVWLDHQDGLQGYVWDVESGQQVSQFPIAQGGLCFAAGTSPGGRYGVVLTQDQLVAFELGSGKRVGQLGHDAIGPNQTYQCQGLFFNAEGDLLAMHVSPVKGPGALVYVWDFSAGEQVARIELPSKEELAQQWDIAPYYQGRDIIWTLDGSGWLLYGQMLLDRTTGEVTKAFPRFGGLHRLPLDRDEVLAAAPWGQSGDFALQRIGDELPPSRDSAAPPEPTTGELAQAEPPQAPDEQDNSDLGPDPEPPEPAEVKPEPVAAEPDSSPDGTETAVAQLPDPAEAPASMPWRATPDPAPQDWEIARKLSIDLPGSFTVEYPERPSRYVSIKRWGDADERTLYDLSSGAPAGRLPSGLKLFTNRPAISPDGKYLAAEPQAPRGTVDVWSLETGERVTQVPLPRQYQRAVWMAFCNPQQLVIVHRVASRFQGLVWDHVQDQPVSQFATQQRLGKQDRVGEMSIALSPGGKYVAVLGNMALHVFDLASGDQVGLAPVPNARSKGAYDAFQPNAVAFSPDGGEVAAMYTMMNNSQPHLVVWDFATGQMQLVRPYYRFHTIETTTMRAHRGRPLAWSPDKEVLMYQGHLLLDRVTGAPVWRFPSTVNEERRLVEPDRLVLPMGQTSQKPPTLQAIPLDRRQLNPVLREARSSIGENHPPLKESDFTTARRLVPDSEPTAWRVQPDVPPAVPTAGRDRIDLKKGPGRVTVAHLASPDLARAVVQRQFGRPRSKPGSTAYGPIESRRETVLEMYDLASGKLRQQMQLPQRYMLLDISPDGSLVLTGERAHWVRDYYPRLDVWAPHLERTHAVGWRGTEPPPQPVNKAVRGAFFLDKRHVFAHSVGRGVLWRLPDCRALYEIPDLGYVRGISPTRKYIITFHHQRGIEIRDTRSGEVVGRLVPPYKTFHPNLTAAQFRNDGQVLATVIHGDGSMQVLLWSVSSGELITEFGLPRVTNEASADLRWLDDRSLLLDHQYLIDLQQEAIVWKYQTPTDFVSLNVQGMVGPQHWLVQTADRALGDVPHTLHGRTLPHEQVRASRLPRQEDFLLMRPGQPIAVEFDGNVPNAAAAQSLLEAKLRSDGFVVDNDTLHRLSFRWRQIPAENPIRAEWQAVLRDSSGATVWEQGGTIPHLREQSLQELVQWLSMPFYVVTEDWESKVPASPLLPVE